MRILIVAYDIIAANVHKMGSWDECKGRWEMEIGSYWTIVVALVGRHGTSAPIMVDDGRGRLV